MKVAAIDIGSNAMRLLICRPIQPHLKNSDFKQVEFLRLPLRLGDDVFQTKIISPKKYDLFIKAMQSFSLLMEIYNVDAYRACATSAMRDAANSKELIADVKKKSGIKIEIISGKEESQIIQNVVIEHMTAKQTLLHIDVGGGSTEVALLHNGKVKAFESFNIGTVRMKEGKVKNSEMTKLKEWLSALPLGNYPEIKAIGTGGNIVKILELAGSKNRDFLNIHLLESTHAFIEKTNLHDRIYELKLNPDRAEVIGFAGRIYLDVMKQCNIHEIQAPDIGLKDGIIRDVWKKMAIKNKLP